MNNLKVIVFISMPKLLTYPNNKSEMAKLKASKTA